jgi:hypothetical protein
MNAGHVSTEAGRPLTPEEQAHVVAAIARWLEAQQS